MPYCTLSDLQAALPEAELIRLTDDSDAGVVDTAKAQEAIIAGAAEIDVYLGGQVKLPLITWPPVLSRLNTDLAIGNLFGRVMMEIPETWRERRQAAIKLLEQFSRGELSLGHELIPSIPEDYSRRTRLVSRKKQFKIETLKRF